MFSIIDKVKLLKFILWVILSNSKAKYNSFYWLHAYGLYTRIFDLSTNTLKKSHWYLIPTIRLEFCVRADVKWSMALKMVYKRLLQWSHCYTMTGLSFQFRTFLAVIPFNMFCFLWSQNAFQNISVLAVFPSSQCSSPYLHD